MDTGHPISAGLLANWLRAHEQNDFLAILSGVRPFAGYLI